MDYVGYVDEISRFCVAGWVADRDDWTKSQTVEILVNQPTFKVKSVAFRKATFDGCLRDKPEKP